MRTACGLEHARGGSAGVCAFFLPEDILAAHANLTALDGLHHGRDVDKRRAENDVIALMTPYQRQKGGHKVARLLRRLEHLPVCGKKILSHGMASARILKCGNAAPNCCATFAYSEYVSESKRTNRTRVIDCGECKCSATVRNAICAAGGTG